jgi:hypothetical protein
MNPYTAAILAIVLDTSAKADRAIAAASTDYSNVPVKAWRWFSF